MAPANSSPQNISMPTFGSPKTRTGSSAGSQSPWRFCGYRPVPGPRSVMSRNQRRDLDGTFTGLSGYHQPTPIRGWTSPRWHPENPSAGHRFEPWTGQTPAPEHPHRRPDRQASGTVHCRCRNRQVSSQSTRQCATISETLSNRQSSQAQQATGDGRHVDCNFRHFEPPLLRGDIRHPGSRSLLECRRYL